MSGNFTTAHAFAEDNPNSLGRATVDDLRFAAEWLDAYEADPDDDANVAAAARAAAWLRAEVARRADAAAIRKLASQTGATPAQARRALRNARQKLAG